MKYNKIILFFNIALIASVITRFFQINNTIDFSTGFFLQSQIVFGYFMLGFIFLMALLSAIFAMTYYKDPENPPLKGDVLGVVSFLPAISITFEIFSQNNMVAVVPLQSLLLKIFGIATAVFFVLYGLGKFHDTQPPAMLTALPVVYVIIRIICDFASISSLALISDYIFLIAGYCVTLLFFMNFLKLYNRVDTEYNFRKIFATGLASSLILISQSVSHIVINLLNSGTYNHVPHTANMSMLSLGIFILTFVFTHFSERNN